MRIRFFKFSYKSIVYINLAGHFVYFSDTSFEHSQCDQWVEYLPKSEGTSDCNAPAILYPTRTISIIFCAEFASNNQVQEKTIQTSILSEKNQQFFNLNVGNDNLFFFYRPHYIKLKYFFDATINLRTFRHEKHHLYY